MFQDNNFNSFSHVTFHFIGFFTPRFGVVLLQSRSVASCHRRNLTAPQVRGDVSVHRWQLLADGKLTFAPRWRDAVHPNDWFDGAQFPLRNRTCFNASQAMKRHVNGEENALNRKIHWKSRGKRITKQMKWETIGFLFSLFILVSAFIPAHSSITINFNDSL